METKIIYWKDALERLRNGEILKDYTVDFRNEPVLWSDSMFLGENGHLVPRELIDYDDDNFDYDDEDDFPISKEDYETGNYEVYTREEYEKELGFSILEEMKKEITVNGVVVRKAIVE